jgi:hypothetical protein
MKSTKLILSFLCSLSYSISAQNVITTSPTGISGYNPAFKFVVNSNGWNTPDMTNPANSITAELIMVNDGTTDDSLGCNSLINGAQISGKIAVVYRGTCDFGTKALNAQNVGAIAVIIINNTPGVLDAAGGSSGPLVNIPVVTITQQDGEYLKTYIEAGGSLCFLGVNAFTNDLAIVSSIHGSAPGNDTINYFQVPFAQVQPIILGAEVANIGTSNQTVNLSATVNSSLFTSVSPSVILPSNDTTTLYTTANFTPSTSGTFNINYQVTGSLPDDFIFDNTQNRTLIVSDSVYARDNNISGTALQYGTNYPSQIYQIFNYDEATSVSINIHPSTLAGTTVTVALYEITYYTGGALPPVFATGSATLTAQDITSGWVHVDLSNGGGLLYPGLYLVSVIDQSGGNLWLYYDNQSSNGQGGYVHDYGTIYFTTETPMIRLNMGCPNTVPSPPPTFSQPTCGGVCDGDIQISSLYSDETSTLLYDLYNNLIATNPPFQGMHNFNNLCAGVYNVVAELASPNCPVISNTFNVTLEYTYQFQGYTAVQAHESYCGANDGSIEIFGTFNGYSSGNPYYPSVTIEWTGPETGSVNYTPSGSTLNYFITGLTAGTYNVSVNSQSGPCIGLDEIQHVSSGVQPQDLCVITVDSSTATYNEIVWEKPAVMGAIDSFYIYREIFTGIFQKIGAVHHDSLSIFKDYSANPNSTSYAYRIGVVDTCGSISDSSLYHKSIHLQYFGSGNFQWTHYEIEGTPNPILSYNFFRDDNGTGNFNLIQLIPGTNNSYTDVNYASFPNAVYRVDVNWMSGATCTATRAINHNTTRSNKRSTIAASDVHDNIAEMTQIYPNPSNGSFTITAPFTKTVEIYSVDGKLIRQFELNTTYSKISMENESTGIYTVVLKGEYGTIVKMIVIH